MIGNPDNFLRYGDGMMRASKITAAIIVLFLSWVPAISVADDWKNKSGKGDRNREEFSKHQEKLRKHQRKQFEKRSEQALKFREEEHQEWEKHREHQEKQQQWDRERHDRRYEYNEDFHSGTHLPPARYLPGQHAYIVIPFYGALEVHPGPQVEPFVPPYSPPTWHNDRRAYPRHAPLMYPPLSPETDLFDHSDD